VYSHATVITSAGSNAPLAQLAEWWTVFNDEQLNTLIRAAASSNLDIRVAHSRVREARALRGLARSALFPQINGGADYARTRQSEHAFTGRELDASGQSLENDFFQLGPDLSWEIDVFGGTRRAVEAAQAELEASIEFSRDVLVSVLAEVGLGYLDLRGAQKQLAVARENLRAQQQTLALTRDRFQAGLASELDTSRAAGQVATTRAQIPPLEETQQRAIHRLSVLLGRPPGELETELAVAAPIPAAPPRVPVGLPSDLLRQRPDIRRAERQLAAATARIGVATADLFPKFFLTAATGLQSIEANDFIDGGSRFWSLGLSVRWPIFTAGRIRQNIRAHDARQEQALLRYEQTVLTSLEEVENALVAFGQEQDRHRALTESEQASRRAAVLANDRYRGGLVDFQRARSRTCAVGGTGQRRPKRTPPESESRAPLQGAGRRLENANERSIIQRCDEPLGQRVELNAPTHVSRHHAELRRLGAVVFGVSTQSNEDQREAVSRLHLPFELL
jgi:NodT family efflux transporter outer membrane factor (OMF) lipoprotein